MKTARFLFLIFLFFPILIFSQSRKKSYDTGINVSTSINYYPSFEPYTFFSEYNIRDRDLILNFITSNSGTFVIEEGQTLFVTRELNSQITSQLLNIGASVQFRKGKALFHEISLAKLSVVKSNYEINLSVLDSLGESVAFPSRGYEQKSSAFAFRYELGKYFSKRKDPSLMFGISGGIEPSFYFYKRTPYTSQEYPLKARLFTLEVSVIPMLTAKLSKKVSLDLKIIPNVLMADFGSFEENNPTLPSSQQAGEREYKSPDINLAFSAMLRYTLKESKRKRKS